MTYRRKTSTVKTFYNIVTFVQSSQVKPLLKALKYTDGHLCRSNPTQYAVFYMDSMKEATHFFRGLLDVELRMNIMHNERDNVATLSCHPVLVEICADVQIQKQVSFST